MIDLSSINYLLTSKSQILHNKGSGLHPVLGLKRVMKATQSRWVLLERAQKTVSLCYFAQSCPTNTFRDIAQTIF